MKIDELAGFLKISKEQAELLLKAYDVIELDLNEEKISDEGWQR